MRWCGKVELGCSFTRACLKWFLSDSFYPKNEEKQQAATIELSVIHISYDSHIIKTLRGTLNLLQLPTMSTKRIVLITGANTGIGYETVKQLLESGRPYHIILGSRSPDKGDEAIARLKDEYPATPSSFAAPADRGHQRRLHLKSFPENQR